MVAGDELLTANRPAEAIPLLERAVETLPQNAVALNRLGLAYQYTGRLDDARKQYLRALKADQNLFEAQHNLGMLHFQTENWIEAERCLRIWLGKHPEDMEAWSRLGLAQFRDGAPLEAAEASLSTAARANQSDPEVWNTLGLVSIKRHKYKEAQQRLLYGLKLEPSNAALHLNLAVLNHQYLNDRRAAVAEYKAFLDLKPDAPEAPAVKAALLQLDPPPVVLPKADATNHIGRPAAAAPATNTPAPVNTRPPPADGTASRPAPQVAEKKPANPPAAPATAKPAVAPPVTSPAAPATAEKARVAPEITNLEKPASQPPAVIKTAAPANAPKEVVKVEDDLKPAPAVDAPPAARPMGADPAAPTNIISTNAVAAAPAGYRPDVPDPGSPPAGKPRSFWTRMNPVRWFSGGPVQEAPGSKPATPLNLPQVSAPMQSVPSNSAAASLVASGTPVLPPQFSPSSPSQVQQAPQLQVQAQPPAPAPPPKPVIPRYKRQSAAALVPGDRQAAQAEFIRASEAIRQRNLSDGAAAYRQAADLDPSYYEAQYNLSLASLENGDTTQAVLAAENATLLQPASEDARLQFASSLQRAGYPADAADEYEKAAAKRPGDSSLQMALASLYAREMLDPAKARPHYEKVLALNPQHPKADAIRAWLAANPR